MEFNSPLERKLVREKAARKEAEKLLEEKSYELYQVNQQLSLALKQLQKQSLQDLQKFEFEEQIDATLIYFGRAFLSRPLDSGLLATFIERLAQSSAIRSALVHIDAGQLDGIESTQLGNPVLAEVKPFVDVPHWQQDYLCLPLVVDRIKAGYLVFEMEDERVEREFVVKQLSLVAELLCSALHRQSIMQRQHSSRKRAEVSEKVTTQFVAMIEQTLHDSLNELMQHSDKLMASKLYKEQLGHLTALQRCGDRMQAVMKDLYEFNQLQTGSIQLSLTPFSWQEIESFLVTEFGQRAMDKGLTFTIDSCDQLPKRWVGAKEQIEQILHHLVDNAIKFTDQGEVMVSARWRHDQLLLRVRDSGIGIPISAYAALFDPYSAVNHSTAQNRQGAGLALPVCKQLAELLGGELDMSSEEGEGSEFFLTLPLKIADA